MNDRTWRRAWGVSVGVLCWLSASTAWATQGAFDSRLIGSVFLSVLCAPVMLGLSIYSAVRLRQEGPLKKTHGEVAWPLSLLGLGLGVLVPVLGTVTLRESGSPVGFLFVATSPLTVLAALSATLAYKLRRKASP